MRTYTCVYFGSAYLALIATPVVIWLARRIGAVDRPSLRTVHERPVPRIGGVAIFLSAMALIVAVIFLNNGVGEAFRRVRLPLLTFLGSATLIFLVGLVDDLRGLPAKCKCVAELFITLVLCMAGVQISEVALTQTWVLPLGAFGCPLTILWVVGITNAVNLSDGLDGLAAGVSAVACGVIAAFAIHSGDVIMAVLMLALVGSLSGFLFFNFNPARVFMGDCGSLFVGFTIAAGSVMCMAKSAALVGLALPMLALGIPIFDTLFSILRRFLERRSLFAPDRSHFHHRLLELGLNQRRAVMLIYIATLLAVGLGLVMLASDSTSSLLVFGSVLLMILLLFRAVGVIRLREVVARLQQKYKYSHQQRQDRTTFEDLELQFRRASEPEQWWQAVCDAADRMEFTCVALKTTYDDGRVEEEIWRAPQTDPSLSRTVLVTMPLDGETAGPQRHFEIAVCVNGSLETASHRVTLFGRLLDEYELMATASDPLPSNPQAANNHRQICTHREAAGRIRKQ